jgi:hypothetical protein
LLDGVVVHHEVIARGGTSATRLPPYRMVDIRQNGVVRLYAADDVPVSVYGGRPVIRCLYGMRSRRGAGRLPVPIGSIQSHRVT